MRGQKKMTPKQKLIVGIGTIIVGIVILSLQNNRSLHDIKSSSQQVLHQSIPYALLAEDAKYQSCQIQQFATDASLTRNPDSIQKTLYAYNQLTQDMKHFTKKFKREHNIEAQQEVIKIQDHADALLKDGLSMVKAYKISKQQGDLAMNTFDPATTQLAEDIEKLVKTQLKNADHESAHIIQEVTLSLQVTTILSGIIFIISVLIGYYLSVDIQKILIKLQTMVNDLRTNKEYLQAIIDNEPECVKLVNSKGELITMNPAGIAMLEGNSLEDIQAHPLTDYLLPKWRKPFLDMFNQVMNGQKASLEFEAKGLKGTQVWLETSSVPMHDKDGNITMLLGITRDITHRKNSEEKIHFLAKFDSLTQLPNRLSLNDKLEYIINLSQQHKRHFALMFLDIDRFKDINDSLGHNIGDLILIKIASRFKSILREDDILSRFGGDEFILILPDTSAVGAKQIAKKLLHVLQTSFEIEKHKLTITTSIGIAMYPEDGTTKEILSKNADSAMYKAKQNGRNNFAFFSKEMHLIAQRSLKLTNDLHNALQNNELHIVYQPQISLHTRQVIGAESLLRWTHPELGNIPPDEFIPLAENSGLILPIGEWVLRTVTKQLKEWIDSGMTPIIIAVNLSSVQFHHADLTKLIIEILKDADLPPEYLELELTESTSMDSHSIAETILQELNSHGIKVSLDDFGTGYSSLSYLKKLKVYKLKIDKSFIKDITTDPEDKAIIKAIIKMAKSLGLTTIAEGVETTQQLEYLQSQNCDEIQGYYFSKPLQTTAFKEFLRQPPL